MTALRPGPTDLEIDADTNEIAAGDYQYWSSDEYPFASTDEGATGAIIRGVPLKENSAQGRDLKDFYRRENVALTANDGEFYVCVKIAGRPFGHCSGP